MAIPLNSENYPILNDNVLSIIMASKYPIISIFTDASGTIYAQDVHGEINNRIVLSVSYTASFTDPSGVESNPYIIIKYKDAVDNAVGTFIDYFTSANYVDDHWYVLSEVPVPTFEF